MNMPDEKPANDQIADVLGRIADLLEVEGTNRFRATVLTETRGRLEGRRVVRRREGACRRFYGLQGSE